MPSERPIIDPYRTVRKSFYEICEKHVTSALILDYLVTLEHALDEARSQGEVFGPWRSLSVEYIASVIIVEPSKNTVKGALGKLQTLCFIEAHPNNAKNTGGFARNSRNQYRLCTANVIAALRLYHAGQNQTAWPDAGQNRPAVLVNFDQQRRSELTSSAGQFRPQDSVIEQVSDIEIESSSSGPTTPTTTNSNYPISDWLKAYLGRDATPLELTIAAEWMVKHDHRRVRDAIQKAARFNGRTLAYVENILTDNNPRQALSTADVPPAVPSTVHALTPEEAEAIFPLSKKGGAP